MRAKEFLFEDYNQQLDSDLNNLLIAIKGNSVYNIDTSALVSQLQDMGYSVDVNSILGLLQNNTNITNATPEEITLVSDEASDGAQPQDNAERVSDMAQKAVDIG